MAIFNFQFSIFKPSRRGQALVESMIALGALTIGFLGVMGLLSRSISLFRVTADQYTGSYLASEGIEIAKNLIDANTIRGNAWGVGLPEGDYEMDYLTDWDSQLPRTFGSGSLRYDPITHLYSSLGSEETQFVRKIHISYPSDDEMLVNSNVSWVTRGGGEFSVDAEDHFYNWRP